MKDKTLDKDKRKKLVERFNYYKKEGQVEFVTFHQNYAYEDFIQGLRPNVKNGNESGGLSFELKDGVFKRISDRAKESSKNYVIIIDEINRANISRVFGELITLIEEDKRLGAENEMTVTLPYSEEKFGVPKNLYIIGTMNTADKSIALLDIALRRRFEFIQMYPTDKLIDELIKDENKREILKKLNEKIRDPEKKGVDFQIGHSYFMNKDCLKNIFNKKIIPLLIEYFMNDTKEVKGILTKTFEIEKAKELELKVDENKYKDEGLIQCSSNEECKSPEPNENKIENLKKPNENISENTGYCLKCKEKVEMVRPKEVVCTNGRTAMNGTCPNCGTQVFCFAKSKNK
ncbi:MAG: hypothetical protein CVU81_01075 [Euryarchaeota archaeon HGW-Euryarchaeota-1]|nr:MAG: hypothetical protein CVU81_01075 [Euryarchaeota archaeon HGW-Euryarchaeota-1]